MISSSSCSRLGSPCILVVVTIPRGEVARISIGYNLLIGRCRLIVFPHLNSLPILSLDHNATFYVGSIRVQSVQPPQLREGVVYRVFPDGSVFYDYSVVHHSRIFLLTYQCFVTLLWLDSRIIIIITTKGDLLTQEIHWTNGTRRNISRINMSDWSGIQYGFYYCHNSLHFNQG
uniref:LAM_G_DOMAIN domain-containing protein n=1 Tax=Heterorhabditis bacteriophora TaxID=37862 RepID=A0A1I7W6J1_HETBA